MWINIYMMEQSPKIQKIFSGIIDLIKFYWFAPQFLYHISVDLVRNNKYVVKIYYAIAYAKHTIYK